MTLNAKKKVGPGILIAALGVVFGDIGTSPLYAFKECVGHVAKEGGDIPTAACGILSLIIWALILLVWVKYITFVLRADNHGEGGILALLNLAFPPSESGKGVRNLPYYLTIVGLLGAALLYGDGVITPAISVLSAVEGITLISPAFAPAVVPSAVAILVALFAVQKFGTQSIGRFFGPIILIWFIAIGYLGAAEVIQHPSILKAANPLVGARFLWEHPTVSFAILGSVVLAVTGGESLYADMGHFGREPIKRAWTWVVMPALLLNYMGQGALILSSPSAIDNPFYKLAPAWAAIPFVLLATMATIIASQALISGAFSLTTAAVQMGYLPRVQILHTNHEESGQIYIPLVNTALASGCIILVIAFGSSSRLAAAYGIAVTLTMLATTTLFYFVTRKKWGWQIWQSAGICALFFIAEAGFASSNLLKFVQGGWIPICIGLTIFTMMVTWKKGRTYVREKASTQMELPGFIDSISLSGVLKPDFQPHRVQGTAVFMSATPNVPPDALIYNLTHNHVLHTQNIVLTIASTKTPSVRVDERLAITRLPEGFLQVTARFGFMEIPTMPEIIECLKKVDIILAKDRTTYFLGRETLVLSEKGLPRWQENLFVLMSRNAQNAAQFFKLPNNRIIEIGKQVEI